MRARQRTGGSAPKRWVAVLGKHVGRLVHLLHRAQLNRKPEATRRRLTCSQQRVHRHLGSKRLGVGRTQRGARPSVPVTGTAIAVADATAHGSRSHLPLHSRATAAPLGRTTAIGGLGGTPRARGGNIGTGQGWSARLLLPGLSAPLTAAQATITASTHRKAAVVPSSGRHPTTEASTGYGARVATGAVVCQRQQQLRRQQHVRLAAARDFQRDARAGHNHRLHTADREAPGNTGGLEADSTGTGVGQRGAKLRERQRRHPKELAVRAQVTGPAARTAAALARVVAGRKQR